MRRGPDPRVYQIVSLASLLAYGMLGLGFDVSAPRVVLLLATCLLSQYVFTALVFPVNHEPAGSERGIHSRASDVGGSPQGARGCVPAGTPRILEWRSALISGLSLCLLLRTNGDALAAAAAFATIASKFVLRVGGKHVFNPTNFGLVAMMLLTGEVWASPGQWGSAAFFAFLIACGGGLTVNRAARSDVSLCFLACWGSLLLLRAAWLGDPLRIPLHQLESGALLLFAFFMISDPKTTPDSRAGRVLFALLVALGAYHVQFRLFRPNGLLWSLAAASPLVPVIDRLLPGRRYDWSAPGSGSRAARWPGLAAPLPSPVAAAR